MGLQDVRERIAAAEGSPGAVTLIAVSKVQPEERVRAVLEQGQRVFGENRVQEAEGRWGVLKPLYEGVKLHLIGPLQTNKVRPAMALFDAIHTVDREKLARAIARVAEETGRCPELFVQVNTGREVQKAGVSPDGADGLIALCRELGLPVVGVMCIPPAEEDPAPHFRVLAEIAARNGLAGLSMGMSGDFEAAIAAGATHVRVGSAVFGDRTAG